MRRYLSIATVAALLIANGCTDKKDEIRESNEEEKSAPALVRTLAPQEQQLVGLWYSDTTADENHISLTYRFNRDRTGSTVYTVTGADTVESAPLYSDTIDFTWFVRDMKITTTATAVSHSDIGEVGQEDISFITKLASDTLIVHTSDARYKFVRRD